MKFFARDKRTKEMGGIKEREGEGKRKMRISKIFIDASRLMVSAVKRVGNTWSRISLKLKNHSGRVLILVNNHSFI